MNIKFNENKLLEAFEWPDVSENGILAYRKTKADFSSTQEICL